MKRIVRFGYCAWAAGASSNPAIKAATIVTVRFICAISCFTESGDREKNRSFRPLALALSLSALPPSRLVGAHSCVLDHFLVLPDLRLDVLAVRFRRRQREREDTDAGEPFFHVAEPEAAVDLRVQLRDDGLRRTTR